MSKENFKLFLSGVIIGFIAGISLMLFFQKFIGSGNTSDAPGFDSEISFNDSDDDAFSDAQTPVTQAQYQEVKKALASDEALNQFKIAGYYPSWEPDKTGQIRYDVLTHILYAFAIPTQDGTLRPLDNPETAKSIIKTAHENNVKVLIAVGGWSYNDIPLESTFFCATDSKEKRDSFVNAIVALCDEYGFDGVDMDWEHPRLDDASGKQYEALMVSLASSLHERGKLLTAAVVSGVTADGSIYYDAPAHSDTVLSSLDWIHVMAYDGGDGEYHSTYDFAVNCAKYWKDTRKLPAEKIVLGMPFYGRPGWYPYNTIIKADPDAWQKDTAQINGYEVWYNGVPSIKQKTQYALKNLGGVMVWEITQDTADFDKSLMTAIGNAVTAE